MSSIAPRNGKGDSWLLHQPFQGPARVPSHYLLQAFDPFYPRSSSFGEKDFAVSRSFFLPQLNEKNSSSNLALARRVASHHLFWRAGKHSVDLNDLIVCLLQWGLNQPIADVLREKLPRGLHSSSREIGAKSSWFKWSKREWKTKRLWKLK